MSMPFLKKLIQRGTTSTELSAQATDAGEALVAASMAPYEETTRSGYHLHCTATTATAGVVALPTRAAGIAMWNSAEDDGKVIVIDAIYAIAATGHATALCTAALICVVGQTDVVEIARTLIPRKNNGNGPAYDAVANIAAGGGTVLDAVTGVAIGWIGIGPTHHFTVTNTPGVVLWADVGGRIIVPPARAFGVNVIASYIGPTWNCGIMWHEKQLTLG